MVSFGLAVNLFLWSVTALVAASASAHLILPGSAPTLVQALDALEANGATGRLPTLPDALLKLVAAESEALRVAGEGLQQPTPPDLASRANAASARVEDAVSAYVRAAQALASH
jgi:hypothetical protein